MLALSFQWYLGCPKMSQVLRYQQTRLLLPRALSFAPLFVGRARFQFFQNDQGALPLAPSVTGRNEAVVGDLQHGLCLDFIWQDLRMTSSSTKCSHFQGNLLNPAVTHAPRCGPLSEHSKGEVLAATGRPPSTGDTHIKRKMYRYILLHYDTSLWFIMYVYICIY